MASKVSGTRKNKTEVRTPEAPAAANTEGTQQVEKKPAATSDPIPDIRERLRLVYLMIDKISQKMRDEEVKSTMAEFLRLCGLAQELEALLPRDIEVTWVDPR